MSRRVQDLYVSSSMIIANEIDQPPLKLQFEHHFTNRCWLYFWQLLGRQKALRWGALNISSPAIPS